MPGSKKSNGENPHDNAQQAERDPANAQGKENLETLKKFFVIFHNLIWGKFWYFSWNSYS